jgi:hypothetical protein
MSLLLLAFACRTAPAPAPAVRFVRTGTWDGATHRRMEWTPGQEVGGRTAPRMAECVTLGTAPLGDLTSRIAAGIPSPDTALAWSPDGSALAVGTWLGEVLVLDGWSGAVRQRRTLADSAVKRVLWSADGSELYAAEQSVDAFLHALDPTTLATRATFRMADELETSAPPGPDDLYGLYTLPGPYALERLGADLLLVGAHGWNTPDGRRNRSRVWRLRRTDEGFHVVAAWPEAPADATFLAATVAGDRIGVAVSRSAGGEAPEGLPIGGVAVLDADLTLRATAVPPPLQPWFDRAFVWESIGLHDDRLTLGLGDGRVWRRDRHRDLGTPLLAGEVPIAATIGHLVDAGEAIYTATSGTSIPYGSARPETHPPEAHPQENRVFALDPTTLETRWTWRGTAGIQGLTYGDPWLVVGVAPTGDRPDAHGVVVFDTRRGGSGADRLVASCSTGQPVFFRTAVAPDGRIAVVSFPEKVDEGVRGDYRVHLFL